jgi:hypothetical protein
MKPVKMLSLSAVLLGAALLAGCESGLPDDVRSALGPRERPRTRTYPADQRAVYEAAKAAAGAMEFRFVRGGPAQGELEALGAISPGDEPGSSRQISMKVHLTPAAESGTDVEVSLTETIEEASASEKGLATETPLRDTPLYEVFFRNLQTALSAPPKD